MATKIRLKRIGRRNRPFYRVVIMDSRARRDGAAIEEIGWYNPITRDKENNYSLKEDRVIHWLKEGAQVTEAVHKLIRRAGIAYKWHLIRQGLDEKAIAKEMQKWALNREQMGNKEAVKEKPKVEKKAKAEDEAEVQAAAPTVEESSEIETGPETDAAPVSEETTEEAATPEDTVDSEGGTKTEAESEAPVSEEVTEEKAASEDQAEAVPEAPAETEAEGDKSDSVEEDTSGDTEPEKPQASTDDDSNEEKG
ncbi:MAG: 30S ribosomal protein S16 [FCB group bacterium]|nr:30S ribosomal protein S16 [FCB group bacterium]